MLADIGDELGLFHNGWHGQFFYIAIPQVLDATSRHARSFKLLTTGDRNADRKEDKEIADDGRVDTVA